MTTKTYNNYDFIRLFASSLVIISHSYPLTGNEEILSLATGGQEALGGLAVNLFFIMSGFLIVQSMKNSPSLLNYFWKRALRLFPALFAMLLFSLLLISLVYTGPSLLSEKSFWTYLPNNLSLYKMQFSVNNVFSDNPYPNAINGSLWSLAYEFTMYIYIGLLFFIRKSKILLPVLIFSFISTYWLSHFHPGFLHNYASKVHLDTSELYRLAQYFIGGAVLSFFNLKKINSYYLIAFFLIVLLLFIYLHAYKFIAPILWPFVTILFGQNYSKILNCVPNKFGDISYGIYIYGFIIQQTLMNYLNLPPTILFLFSLPVVFILAYFSWILIEKRCMKFKNII